MPDNYHQERRGDDVPEPAYRSTPGSPPHARYEPTPPSNLAAPSGPQELWQPGTHPASLAHPHARDSSKHRRNGHHSDIMRAAQTFPAIPLPQTGAGQPD